MTSTIRKRGGIRSVFSKGYTTLLNLLAGEYDLDDVNGRFAAFEGKYLELLALNREILDELYNDIADESDELKSHEVDERLVEELMGSEEYTIKYNVMKAKVENAQKTLMSNGDDDSRSDNSRRTDKHFSGLRYPKLKLDEYDGSVCGWINFWAQFSTIDGDSAQSDEQKFQYLLQSTKPESKAWKIVSSFPPSGANYPKALASLKERCGREDLLIEFYIRQLLKLVSENKGLSLADLYDRLETQLRALETLNVVSDSYSAILFPLVESCLPSDVLRIWQRSNVGDSGNSSFQEQMSSLMAFLKTEVKAQERVELACHEREPSSSKKVPQNREPPSKGYAAAASLACLTLNDDCVFCEGRHKSAECWKARDMTLDERTTVLAKARCCFACTASDHRAQHCRARCPSCKGRHVELMCQRTKSDRGSNPNVKVAEKGSKEVSLLSVNHSMTVSSSPEICLQTFCVFLRNGDQRRKVRVLIDCGSQRSYLRTALCKEMAYDSLGEVSLVHSLFGGCNTGIVKHRTYKVRLLSLDGKFACNFTALDQGNIAAFIPTVKPNTAVGRELEERGIRLIEDEAGPIDVLIGADIVGKVWTGQCVVMKCGAAAVENSFGWTLVGPCAGYCEPTQQYSSNLATTFTMMTMATGDNVEEAKEFQRVDTDVMSTEGFNLRDWDHSDDGHRNDETSILGLKWDCWNDTLRLNMEWWEKYTRTDVLTKRSILSMAQRIFDPIGFSVPVTLHLKSMVQQLWEERVDWDDPLDDKMRESFESWLENVGLLKDIRVRRNVGSSTMRTLHLFTDASAKAYAAAVFLRSETVDGRVFVSLVQAKARVAPLKELTMPRLELLGATIGARLLHSVQEAFGWLDVPAYAWTDSSTVLAWIVRKEEWSVFVRNRIKEIRELTPGVLWRHIPGTDNPADLPSRGCTAAQLCQSRWWEGPTWLQGPMTAWPDSPCSYQEEDVLAERLKRSVNLLATDSVVSHKWLYHYFSKFEKIVRMVAWQLRFVKNCQKGVRVRGQLSVKELEAAELKVVKLVQEETFNSIVDKRFHELLPFKDAFGILRLHTRIAERDYDSIIFRTPAVLPSEHPVVERMIYDLHCRMNHVGVNTLRENYWILRGRQLVRRIVSKCVVCKRFSSKNFDAFSPPLPETRVRDSYVFEVTGVDLAGPLYTREGSKVWICLFTCANFRAVHLELVPALSTESFILALRRFISRRGRPKIFYSDNGSNFRGADSVFSQLDWYKIATYSIAERIDWRFNPPTAAWWGGFWEKLVGLVKQLLRKTLQKAAFTLEELSTVICDCEAQVNSRPLTHVSETNSDPVPLTPAMYLQELQTIEVPDCDQFEEDHLLRRLRYRRRICEQLRRRFRLEYLGQLSWTKRKNTREPSLGEVVLVGAENTKRLDWPLAVVVRLIPGRDGRVRVLELRTSTGVITRPIQRVYPLEIHVEASNEDTGPQEEKRVEMSGDQEDDLTEEDSLDNHHVVTKTTRAGRIIVPPKKLNL